MTLLIGSCLTVAAQAPVSADESAIRAAIAKQAAAWNRGDIPDFMKAYEDSPETTFIGTSLRKGYQPILERYQKSYSNPAQMGTLTFTDVEVRLLPASCGKAELAVVTGRFHLQRSAKGRCHQGRRNLLASVAQGRAWLEDPAGPHQLSATQGERDFDC